MRLLLAGPLVIASLAASCACAIAQGNPQDATKAPAPDAHDYSGVSIHIPGIYVPAVPNAPFTAEEQMVSHQKLADGTERVLMTTLHVGRASSGMTYGERRELIAPGTTRTPRLKEIFLYNPSSLTWIALDPYTHLAHEQVLTHPRPLSAGPTTLGPKRPGMVETDLGAKTLDGLELHGLRRERTIPAENSGIGKAIVITDDYWYSEALHTYVIVRHDDPRTGEQMIALSAIDQHDPPTTLFTVGPEYKVVDETPLPRVPPAH